MRKPFTGWIVGLLAVLAFLPVGMAQETQPPANRAQPGTVSVFDKLSDTKPSGPAPIRDLTGAWAGLADSEPQDMPAMTPLGQEQFRLNKPERKYSLAETNDPFVRCDPLGMPRKLLNQTRGVLFAQMPDRVLQLWQHGSVWREIFTDGRELPRNVGGRSKDAPDPRWFGYSVGHWEGDYTFVVDTVGSDDRSWIDGLGYPHSIDMRIEERYTRVDHDTLELAVKIDDPKFYTKPIFAQNHFKWIPKQEFEEQMCVPSEASEYQRIIGIPAGNGSRAK